MTGKEWADSILKMLEILISWPVILLVVIVLVRRDLPKLLASLAERITKAPGGFEFAKLEKQVEALDAKVDQIREQFVISSGGSMAPGDQKALETSLLAYQGYLRKLGYEPTEGRVQVDVRPNDNNAHYDGANNRIVIDPELVPDRDVAFREYTHHVLLTVVPWQPDTSGTWQPDNWDVRGSSLESGLADYFPLSFTGDPRLATVWAPRMMQQPFIRNLDNQRSFAEIQPDMPSQIAGEVWGGAFWEIRKILGKDQADRLLFAA